MSDQKLTQYTLTKDGEEILTLIRIIWNAKYSKTLDYEIKDNCEVLSFVLNTFKKLFTNQAHSIKEAEDSVDIIIRFAKPKDKDS